MCEMNGITSVPIRDWCSVGKYQLFSALDAVMILGEEHSENYSLLERLCS